MYRVGVDTGGTFTDLVAVDEETGAVFVSKRPTTPAEPAVGVLDALDTSAVPPREIGTFVLGTTIAANAYLEGAGAPVIYIGTDGFQDIPIIGSVSRPHAYDLSWIKPQPRVQRRHCLGLRERINYRGDVVDALEDVEVERIIGTIRELSATSSTPFAIAVNLLFSYLNPEHEQRIGRRSDPRSRISPSLSRTKSRRSGANTRALRPRSSPRRSSPSFRTSSATSTRT